MKLITFEVSGAERFGAVVDADGRPHALDFVAFAAALREDPSRTGASLLEQTRSGAQIGRAHV